MIRSTIKEAKDFVKDGATGTYYIGKALYNLGKIAVKVAVVGGAVALGVYMMNSNANAETNNLSYRYSTMNNNIEFSRMIKNQIGNSTTYKTLDKVVRG